MDDDAEGGAPGLPPYVRDPVGAIRRRWPWMVIGLCTGIVATALFVAQLEPRYVASAAVRIASHQRLDAILAAVLSREKLAGLIEKYELYPELRENTTLAELTDRMRDDIDVTREEGLGSRSRRQEASLLAIAFEADRPDVAAAVANDLAGAFRDASIESRTEQLRSSTEFLRRKVEEADQELRAQERQISEFKQQHRGDLLDDLTANRIELDRLREKRQSLVNQIEHNQTMRAPGESDSLEQRLSELYAQLEKDSRHLTDRHPHIVALKRDIAGLEEIRAGLPESGPPDQGGALPALRAELSATNGAIGKLEARVDRTPMRQEELAALERRAGVLLETWRELRRKLKDADMALSLELEQQGERVEIVDAAIPPAAPSFSRWKYLAAGLAGSLLLSLALGALFEALDPVVLASDQLEMTAQLPVLGSAPRIL